MRDTARSVKGLGMKIDERWIDDVDRELYRIMNQCPMAKEYTELYMALQRARSESFRMLPRNRQKELKNVQ